MTMQADFVIVGAGSAGSAMAARLSEDGKHSVIVIEHGGSDFGPVHPDAGGAVLPDEHGALRLGLHHRTGSQSGQPAAAAPRGKVIGGSSSINGMVFVRGHAGDFNHWAEQGANGWSFADVLPYFKRMETSHQDGGIGGEDGWRGTDGPLHVQRGPAVNPLFSAFIEAGRQAGYGVTQDYNGSRQEGFGLMEQTIHKGQRWSAAQAYLKPALKRKNVKSRQGPGASCCHRESPRHRGRAR